jgi:aldehyde dehydrogenase (NAD+)
MEEEVIETESTVSRNNAPNTDITRLIDKQRAFFNAGETKGVRFRIRQLKNLKEALETHEGSIMLALKADLRKPELEAWSTEIGVIITEIDYNLKHIRSWVRPQRVPTALFFMPGKSRIYTEPFGVALIIGPWNFPIKSVLGPALGAMTAGNCCVLKPSEHAPHTAKALENMISEFFDPEYLVVTQGGIPETTELLKHRFDYVFFTGGTEIGRIVYQAAAKHLTPVTLELGGKNPCIVDDNSHMQVAAKRIAWGKLLNSGQVCIAPNYVLVKKSVKKELIEHLKIAIEEFFGGDAKSTDDFGRIVNDTHFERIKKLIEGDVVLGGDTDAKEKYIAPTIIDNVKVTDKIMQEEIFGPVLPIVEYEDIDEAISIINQGEKPLALYIFSKSYNNRDKIISQTSSGGVCINETIMNFGSVELPFGGVGDSGFGVYNGKSGFDTFSHKKGVMTKSFMFDVKQKYPPYTQGKLNFIKFAIRKLI